MSQVCTDQDKSDLNINFQKILASSDPKNKLPIECSQSELEKVLEQAVKLTDGLSLIQLLDLYNLLSRIIKKFSRTTVRTSLPKVRI